MLASLLGLVVAGAAGYASIALAGRVLNDCEVGTGVASGLGLLLQWPVLTVLDLVALAVAYAFVYRRIARWFVAVPVALVAALVLFAFVAWAVVAWNVPADYPGVCVGGRSEWWPGWLPV